MQYFFAPMEGLTDRIYRQTHHAFFPGMDGYYMPFLSPTMHRTLTNRESRDLPPASSVPFRAVPQILTKVPEDFLWAARQCAQRGYDEVNLNLGCPSGTFPKERAPVCWQTLQNWMNFWTRFLPRRRCPYR